MAGEQKIVTETRFDGNRAETVFPGHPEISVEGLGGIANAPGAWSPPHLMVAAVESCFLMTLLPVADKMRIGIKSYSSSAEGVLVSPDGKHKEFSEIVIRPKIVLADESDRAKLPQLVRLAEEYCLVERSLKSKFRIEISDWPSQ